MIGGKANEFGIDVLPEEVEVLVEWGGISLLVVKPYVSPKDWGES